MYNKNNPNYKLYLAGIITENQYYEAIDDDIYKSKFEKLHQDVIDSEKKLESLTKEIEEKKYVSKYGMNNKINIGRAAYRAESEDRDTEEMFKITYDKIGSTGNVIKKQVYNSNYDQTHKWPNSEDRKKVQKYIDEPIDLLKAIEEEEYKIKIQFRKKEDLLISAIRNFIQEKKSNSNWKEEWEKIWSELESLPFIEKKTRTSIRDQSDPDGYTRITNTSVDLKYKSSYPSNRNDVSFISYDEHPSTQIITTRDNPDR